MKRRAAWLVLPMAAGATAGPAPGTDPGVPRGEVVERVVCRADPASSYALYLPTAYDATRPWPAVFALDPAARGKLPVERFRAGGGPRLRDRRLETTPGTARSSPRRAPSP
jgi:hypothetical protein